MEIRQNSINRVMAFSWSSSWMFVKNGAEAMYEMGKVLLGVVVTLKVHEEYGRREVRLAHLVKD